MRMMKAKVHKVCVPLGHWTKTENKRAFFDSISKQLNIQVQEDWYSVRNKDITTRGGGGLLKYYYNNSLHDALKSVYPEYQWDSSLLVRKKKKHHLKNPTTFIPYLEEALNITQKEDWYSITVEDVKKKGGGSLLSSYNGSLSRMLTALYPSHDWLPWLFTNTPSEYWNSLAHHKKFFDWISGELGIETQSDWYSITRDNISQLGGHSLLLQHYSNSVSTALTAVYPQYQWLEWLFRECPYTYWHKLEHQRKYLDWYIEEQLGSSADVTLFYQLSHAQISSVPFLQSLYNGSFINALRAVYPENEWYEWKFEKVSVSLGFWRNSSNVMNFLDWLSKELNITQLEDWYSVSYTQIARLGGRSLLDLENGMLALLSRYYPQHAWNPSLMLCDYEKSQKHLLSIVTSLFH